MFVVSVCLSVSHLTAVAPSSEQREGKGSPERLTSLPHCLAQQFPSLRIGSYGKHVIFMWLESAYRQTTVIISWHLNKNGNLELWCR